MLNPPLFVIYDDAASGMPNVHGNVTNLEAFCRAIEQGHIKNVRLWEEPERDEPRGFVTENL